MIEIYEIEFGKDRYHQLREMAEWLRQNIGAGGWVHTDPDDWDERNWAMSSIFGNSVFYFKNQADATAFTLRWS